MGEAIQEETQSSSTRSGMIARASTRASIVGLRVEAAAAAKARARARAKMTATPLGEPWHSRFRSYRRQGKQHERVLPVDSMCCPLVSCGVVDFGSSSDCSLLVSHISYLRLHASRGMLGR